MTTIRVNIDRLVLHAPQTGLSPEISRDLGALVTTRLEQLAAGADHRDPSAELSQAHQIANRVADQVWRSVVEQREVRR